MGYSIPSQAATPLHELKRSATPPQSCNIAPRAATPRRRLKPHPPAGFSLTVSSPHRSRPFRAAASPRLKGSPTQGKEPQSVPNPTACAGGAGLWGRKVPAHMTVVRTDSSATCGEKVSQRRKSDLPCHGCEETSIPALSLPCLLGTHPHQSAQFAPGRALQSAVCQRSLSPEQREGAGRCPVLCPQQGRGDGGFGEDEMFQAGFSNHGYRFPFLSLSRSGEPSLPLPSLLSTLVGWRGRSHC